MTPNKEALALAERLHSGYSNPNKCYMTVSQIATEITRLMQTVAEEGTWIAQEAADAGMEAVLKMAKKNSGLMQPRAQSGGEVDVMPWARRTAEERARHLEMMAAAYIKKTGLPPDECELCEQTEGTATRWWFRPKKETLRAALTGGWKLIPEGGVDFEKPDVVTILGQKRSDGSWFCETPTIASFASIGHTHYCEIPTPPADGEKV